MDNNSDIYDLLPPTKRRKTTPRINDGFATNSNLPPDNNVVSEPNQSELKEESSIKEDNNKNAQSSINLVEFAKPKQLTLTTETKEKLEAYIFSNRTNISWDTLIEALIELGLERPTLLKSATNLATTKLTARKLSGNKRRAKTINQKYF